MYNLILKIVVRKEDFTPEGRTGGQQFMSKAGYFVITQNHYLFLPKIYPGNPFSHAPLNRVFCVSNGS